MPRWLQFRVQSFHTFGCNLQYTYIHPWRLIGCSLLSFSGTTSAVICCHSSVPRWLQSVVNFWCRIGCNMPSFLGATVAAVCCSWKAIVYCSVMCHIDWRSSHSAAMLAEVILCCRFSRKSFAVQVLLANIKGHPYLKSTTGPYRQQWNKIVDAQEVLLDFWSFLLRLMLESHGRTSVSDSVG